MRIAPLLPSSPGDNVTSAPKISSSWRRSTDTFSGMSNNDLYVAGGTLNLDHSLVKTSADVGVKFVGGTGTLNYDDVVNNNYGGIYLGTAGVTVTNSIVTGNIGNYGIYNISAATLTYNDVWGNAYGNYYSGSGSTGSLSANPLYVGIPNYQLTSNSPARFADNTSPSASRPPVIRRSNASSARQSICT